MLKAYVPASTKHANRQETHQNIAVNLDVATRAQIITAACVQLYNLGQTYQIAEWRKRAADWDFFTLIGRARDLGVEFRQGSEPFQLPMELHHK
jgi:hypothetical protein